MSNISNFEEWNLSFLFVSSKSNSSALPTSLLLDVQINVLSISWTSESSQKVDFLRKFKLQIVIAGKATFVGSLRAIRLELEYLESALRKAFNFAYVLVVQMNNNCLLMCSCVKMNSVKENHTHWKYFKNTIQIK